MCFEALVISKENSPETSNTVIINIVTKENSCSRMLTAGMFRTVF
jgi:hypothetical protein